MARPRSGGWPAPPPFAFRACTAGRPGGAPAAPPAAPRAAGRGPRVAPPLWWPPPVGGGVLDRPGGSSGAWAAAPAVAGPRAVALVPPPPPGRAALGSPRRPLLCRRWPRRGGLSLLWGPGVPAPGPPGPRAASPAGFLSRPPHPLCLPLSVLLLRPGLSPCLSPCLPPAPAPPAGGLRGAPSLRLWGCGPGPVGASPGPPSHCLPWPRPSLSHYTGGSRARQAAHWAALDSPGAGAVPGNGAKITGGTYHDRQNHRTTHPENQPP